MSDSMYDGGDAVGREGGSGPAGGSRTARLLAIALVLAGLLACGGSTPPPVHAPEPAPVSRPSTTHFTRLADATTLAILTTSNNVDLAYARIAAARASGRDVKAFARRMTQDHTTLNSALTFLALRLDITPREDEISRVLRDQSATRRDSLRTFTGRRFDSAYVANEVRYHQELLVAIDRVFLPSVRRPEIREFVTNLRPTISAHLAHAEQLQAALEVPVRR